MQATQRGLVSSNIYLMLYSCLRKSMSLSPPNLVLLPRVPRNYSGPLREILLRGGDAQRGTMFPLELCVFFKHMPLTLSAFLVIQKAPPWGLYLPNCEQCVFEPFCCSPFARQPRGLASLDVACLRLVSHMLWTRVAIPALTADIQLFRLLLYIVRLPWQIV